MIFLFICLNIMQQLMVNRKRNIKCTVKYLILFFFVKNYCTAIIAATTRKNPVTIPKECRYFCWARN